MNSEDLLNIAAKATKGEMDHKQAHALIQASTGKAGIFKDNKTLPIADKFRKPVVVGKRYRSEKLKGAVIIPTKAEFGAGNLADTYYRVFYISGEELKETWTIVDGRGSPFSGFRYESDFEPLDD